MDNFCVEGSLTNPKCVTFESFDFPSEERLFEILLDVFKSELPSKMAALIGCDDKPLFITEKAIDLTPPQKEVRFSLVFNPLGDLPVYNQGRNYRTVEYNFELNLQSINKSLRCVTWELIKFKNAVEGLIIGAELAIDGYDSVDLEPKGFAYSLPLVGSGKYFREGAYRFSVTVSQYKI